MDIAVVDEEFPPVANPPAMDEVMGGHQALLAGSQDHRRAATEAWVRGARLRREKVVRVALAGDGGSAGRAAHEAAPGHPVTPLSPDQVRGTGRPADLVERALDEGFRGLSVLVCGDCVIDGWSAEVHADIEATLDQLCHRQPVSALCIFARGTDPDRLDGAIARHPAGLRGDRAGVRRADGVLAVDGEIDESNVEVLAAALRRATDTSSATVGIDLSGLRFLGAAGASALAVGTAGYRGRGGRVELRAATPHIVRVLQLLHLDGLPGLHLVDARS